MSEMYDFAAYLSEEIGARPAGTEEERQAAFYVAEALQRKAGLQSQVEDFTCPIDFELSRAILAGISVVLCLLSLIFPLLVLPVFIVTLVTAALYCIEVLVKPIIARAISHGVSQNVVARYEPNEYTETSAQRHRKVILVSHYDSGKVQTLLTPAFIGIMPMLNWAVVVAMVLIPLLELIRLIFTPTEVFGIIVTVFSVIALIIALVPVVTMLLRRVAPYNEAANCNASGVAVLMEVAARVRQGREKALAAKAEVVPTGVRIHGAAAARANDLVPDGADLVYETSETGEETSAEDRLMAAKAAVAMLTGKPVSATLNIDLADDTPDAAPQVFTEADIAATNAAYVANALEGVDIPAATAAAGAPAAQAAPEATGEEVEEEAVFVGENSTDQAPVTFLRNGMEPPAPAPVSRTITFVPEEKSNVPDWFTAARAKAKQNAADEEGAAPIQRSRYAQAQELAQREIEARIEAERAEAAAKTTPDDTEARLEEMRAAIIANYPTSAEAAAAAAKREAEETEEEIVDVESATTAFAPVMIDGEQLKQEAAAQAGSPAIEQVVVQGEVDIPKAAPAPGPDAPPASAPQATSTPQSRPLSASIPLPVPTASQAPAVPAEKLQSLIPQSATSKEKPSEEQKTRQSALRQILPSLSGSIKMPDPEKDLAEEEEKDPSSTDSFSPVAATAVFSAIDEEDYEEIDEEAADDIDESQFESSGIEASGHLDMPDSRASRLFGKFRRNKKKAANQHETSAQEWLDVDEDFDARTVGEARGSWESFREDYDEDFLDDGDDGYDDFEEAGFRPRGWNGGAFSLKGLADVRNKLGSAVSRHKKDGEVDLDADVDAEAEADVVVNEEIDYVPEPEETAEATDDRFLTGTREAGQVRNEQATILNFHEPNIEIEVWFVALGAELAGNGGMNAFLTEHSDELRGAIFVDVEALGAGELKLIDEEGMYFPVKGSSRMDRYCRNAAAACGMHVDHAKMLWRNSAAALAMRSGSQAMHLAGMKDGKPAYCAQSNDTMQNIDEEKLARNADFLVELLRSI